MRKLCCCCCKKSKKLKIRDKNTEIGKPKKKISSFMHRIINVGKRLELEKKFEKAGKKKIKLIPKSKKINEIRDSSNPYKDETKQLFT